MRTFTVGTRGSKLALIQTKKIINALKEAGVNHSIKIKEIATKGDKAVHIPLSKMDGGVFLQEIEAELIDGSIDFAVHSLKDIPVELPPDLIIASIPEREDFRDAFLANHHVKLHDLPAGAIVGTSSLRRAAQVLSQRPDLEIKWIRGPIDSRIKQLQHGDFDAIILAVAGMKRLGLGMDLITEYLPADTFMPAIGQGALAIECRTDDQELRDILRLINNQESEQTVLTERLFMKQFENGEKAAIAGYATVENGEIVLHATVLSPDGKTVIKHEGRGKTPEEVAQYVADQLKDKGASEIIQLTLQEFSRQ